MKIFFLILGHLCIALGILGIFLPLLPTTPFVIAASACYIRSSERFHRMLHESKSFGPALRDWERNKSISRRAKAIAVTTIAVTIVFTVAMIPIFAVQVVVITIEVIVSIFILTRPSPGKDSGALESRATVQQENHGGGV